MLSLRYSPEIITRRVESIHISGNLRGVVVCAAKGPRPRYPRVWKSKNKIGTISKSEKLVECIKGLSNVKEEVYGALDSFIAWELEFPLITVKKALKTLENGHEWKRIIQVTKWMLSKGQGRTMGSYFTLLNALAQDGRLEEAEELWMKVFSENLESLPRYFFDKMMSIYHSRGMHDKMFEFSRRWRLLSMWLKFPKSWSLGPKIFADMEELGVRPSISIVSMVGEAFKRLGMLEKYDKLIKKYPPPKWEFRYIKGKRVRIRSKRLNEFDEEANKGVNESDEEADTNSNEFDDRSLNEMNTSIRLEGHPPFCFPACEHTSKGLCPAIRSTTVTIESIIFLWGII
ncbi:hypothetical protein HHK36_033391 [Tetracentron sinense]|uniref:Pentatricopeptide repeat-containing protein n=1 Tax=Tetracentron sinense TaxID=13715 RepID=A0A835CYR4_TETSI|nr:hypothetical protein HHK36_033391 [Tetracentron sinense]